MKCYSDRMDMANDYANRRLVRITKMEKIISEEMSRLIAEAYYQGYLQGVQDESAAKAVTSIEGKS